MGKKKGGKKGDTLDPEVAQSRQEFEEVAGNVKNEFEALSATVSNILNDANEDDDEDAEEKSLNVNITVNLLDNMSRKLENDLATMESIDTFNPSIIPFDQLDALVPKNGTAFLKEYEEQLESERAAKEATQENEDETDKNENQNDGDGAVVVGEEPQPVNGKDQMDEDWVVIDEEETGANEEKNGDVEEEGKKETNSDISDDAVIVPSQDQTPQDSEEDDGSLVEFGDEEEGSFIEIESTDSQS